MLEQQSVIDSKVFGLRSECGLSRSPDSSATLTAAQGTPTPSVLVAVRSSTKESSVKRRGRSAPPTFSTLPAVLHRTALLPAAQNVCTSRGRSRGRSSEPTEQTSARAASSPPASSWRCRSLDGHVLAEGSLPASSDEIRQSLPDCQAGDFFQVVGFPSEGTHHDDGVNELIALKRKIPPPGAPLPGFRDYFDACDGTWKRAASGKGFRPIAAEGGA